MSSTLATRTGSLHDFAPGHPGPSLSSFLSAPPVTLARPVPVEVLDADTLRRLGGGLVIGTHLDGTHLMGAVEWPADLDAMAGDEADGQPQARCQFRADGSLRKVVVELTPGAAKVASSRGGCGCDDGGGPCACERAAFRERIADSAAAFAAKAAGKPAGGPAKARKGITGGKSGRWVTIHGHPCFIQGGKITKGGFPGMTHHAEHGTPLGEVKAGKAPAKVKAEPKAKVEPKSKAEKPAKPPAKPAANPIAAHVAKHAAVASSAKADHAAAHLKTLHGEAKAGKHDAAAVGKHVDRIARGATKDELFRAAKHAGIEHGAKTKKELVAHLKDTHAGTEAKGEAARPAGPPEKPATAAKSPATASPSPAVKVDRAARKAYDEQRTYIDAEHAPAVARLAKDVGMTPSQYRTEVNGRLGELAGHGDHYVRAHPEALASILRDGRFKTQFETGTTGGALDPSGRKHAEAALFGTAPGKAAAKRPVYGYVSTPDFGSVGNASQAHVEGYGSAVIRLRPHVKDQATLTVGDSLGRHDMLQAAPATAPDLRMAPVHRPAWEGVHKLLLDRVGTKDQRLEGLASHFGFVEAQHHGGLKASDIRDVAFRAHPPEHVVKALAAKKIPWRVIGDQS